MPATIRSRSELPSESPLAVGEQVLLARVDDEVAVDLADPHRADGRGERDVGDHQRRRGAVHGEDVVGVDVVDRERDRHQLRVIAPVLGEQRADRAVDHARGQRRLLARAALALEERAGDLPGGVHALLDVHRQREEVDVAHGSGDGGRKDHRVALADDHCAGGLLGHPAGLKRDLAARDLHGDPRNGITTHIHCLPVPPVGRRSVFFFSYPNGPSLADGGRRTRRRGPCQALRASRSAAEGVTARQALAQQSTPGSSPGEAPDSSSARPRRGRSTISARCGKPPSWSTPKAGRQPPWARSPTAARLLDAELLRERALRPRRVAGDAVERRALLGQLAEHLLVQLQLVGAHGAERERVEDEHASSRPAGPAR